MKKVMIALMMITITMSVITFVSCNVKNKELSLEQPFADEMATAYESHKWENVVSLGDSAKSMGFDFMAEESSPYTICYAEGLSEVGRYSEAVTILKAYLDKFPDDYYITQSLGTVYWRSNNNKMAHKYYEITFKINPYYARPYVDNAELYEVEKDYENAIDNYLSALDLFASNDKYAEIIEFSGKILDMPVELSYSCKSICMILKAYGYKKLGSDSMYSTIRNKMRNEETASLDSLCNLGWNKYVEAKTR